MSRDENALRFEEVSFEYGHNHPILDTVSLSVKYNSKVAIMGQNGAGKTTLFGIMTGVNKPESGRVLIPHGLSLATAPQVIPRDQLDLTVIEFFEKCLNKNLDKKGVEKIYDVEPRIHSVLKVVHLTAPLDRQIRSFSGGQQARLLLASALIQDPDLLLLDEPTNNLDKAGIEHLTKFLIDYKKTCIVISHDAEFLNAFTDGVLYLDVFTKKVEQYNGNYNDVLKDITARIERENRKNAQLEKKIQENKDKANFFAQKGGKMRLVAKKMREEAEEMEEDKVDVRKEDRTIRPFTIPVPTELYGDILTINSFTTQKAGKTVEHKAQVALRKNQHLQLKGPNGIGKSTLLEALATGKAKGAIIAPDTVVGYYRQDFSTLNFDHTVREALFSVMKKPNEEDMRKVAAGFILVGDIIKKRVGDLSEGQKGLVAFAQLVLLRPGLLILDEPTNHINFRHLPVIAQALDEYEGAMLLVSHVPEFVSGIRIDQVLDMEK